MAEEKKYSISPKEEVGSSDSESKKPKLFSCQYCDKQFPVRHALAGHQNAHWREKSEAKNLKRKREDPIPSTTPYPSFFYQNLQLTSPPHIDSLSRNYGLYQPGYPPHPLISNRLPPNAAHYGLNIPVGRTSPAGRESHAYLSSNLLLWQRYRERMAQFREFLSTPLSNDLSSSYVQETETVCSANEKNLDLSLHL